MPNPPPAAPSSSPSPIPGPAQAPSAPAPAAPAPAPAPGAAAVPKPVYINFFGQIKEDTATKFMTAIAEVIKIDNPDCLYFLFSSPGGDVNAGVAIYNYL